MWIVISIVVAVVAAWSFMVMKAAAMNRDPVQQELARLIMEMMANGATDDAQLIFSLSSTRAMMTRMIDPREQQTRLAHALSMVKPMLNPLGYDTARQIIRGMA